MLETTVRASTVVDDFESECSEHREWIVKTIGRICKSNWIVEKNEFAGELNGFVNQ